MESLPVIRRQNAVRPGAAVAHVASRSPRLPRCQGASIVRRCPWLRVARHRQPGCDAHLPVTPFKHSPWSRTHCVHTTFAHRLRLFHSPSVGRLPGSASDTLCTCYTIRRISCAIGGRMIAPYQSLRDTPFRLYGSLRAVNVLLASCAPHCTALAPPPALLVWLHAGVIIVESSFRHEGL